MSDIWTFSPTSQALLQRCIDAAPPPDDENKWYKHLREKSSTTDESNIIVNNSVKHYEDTSTPLLEKQEDIKEVILDSEIEENFLENLETEPIARFDCFVEKSMKTPKLIAIIAEKLSTSAIEKICNQLFNQEVINTDFIVDFYKYFFPTYLRRDYSWLSLDLLVKSVKAYPLEFKKLLYLLLKDTEISNKVLFDYVSTLNVSGKFEFLKNLAAIEINCAEFKHHLLTIYTVYKDSKKNEEIQTFIKENLLQYSEQCATEKNYGRLLLTYLQSQESVIQDFGKFERIINTHRTPFKKPCESVLQQNKNKFNA